MTLDGIDFGADFAALALGSELVTVTSVNPDTGAALATAAAVPAVQTPTRRDTTPARGGEVGVTACDWWVRVDQLTFALKPKDWITQAGGTKWSVDSVEETVGALVRCPATRTR